MPHFKLNVDDFVGNKYGFLTIEGVLEPHKYPSYTRMLCKCDCGSTVTPLLHQITGGKVLSCGCYAKEIASKTHLKDESGNTYGNVTVLERDGSNAKGQATWKCRCNLCGQVFVTQGRILRGSKNFSCRKCANKQTGLDRRSVSIGDKYGILTVVDIYDVDDTRNNDSKYLCNCECECGNKTVLDAGRLVSGNTKSCGCLLHSYDALKKQSATVRNIPIEEWTGFSYESSILEQRFSPEYKKWRRRVCNRDNWTCVKCGLVLKGNGIDLHAHHINSFTDYPDQRFDISNGVALCKTCHSIIYKGSFHNTYGTHHNTRQQFEEWMNTPLEIKENA